MPVETRRGGRVASPPPCVRGSALGCDSHEAAPQTCRNAASGSGSDQRDPVDLTRSVTVRDTVSRPLVGCRVRISAVTAADERRSSSCRPARPSRSSRRARRPRRTRNEALASSAPLRGPRATERRARSSRAPTQSRSARAEQPSTKLAEVRRPFTAPREPTMPGTAVEVGGAGGGGGGGGGWPHGDRGCPGGGGAHDGERCSHDASMPGSSSGSKITLSLPTPQRKVSAEFWESYPYS